MAKTQKTGEYVIRIYKVGDAEPVRLRYGGEQIVPVEARSTFLNGRWIELHLRPQSGSNERSVILTLDDQPLPAWMKALTEFEEDRSGGSGRGRS